MTSRAAMTARALKSRYRVAGSGVVLSDNAARDDFNGIMAPVRAMERKAQDAEQATTRHPALITDFPEPK